MSKKTILIIFFAVLVLASFVLADADINDDGKIDLSDLVLVTTYFGKKTDDYAACGNDASLEIGTSDWTITAWIKLETTQPTWTGIIEKGGTTLTTEGYWLSYYLTNGDLRLYISDGTTREYLDSNDNLNLNDGAWHHLE